MLFESTSFIWNHFGYLVPALLFGTISAIWYHLWYFVMPLLFGTPIDDWYYTSYLVSYVLFGTTCALFVSWTFRKRCPSSLFVIVIYLQRFLLFWHSLSYLWCIVFFCDLQVLLSFFFVAFFTLAFPKGKAKVFIWPK